MNSPLHARLESLGQQHLVAFWDRLSESQRKSLTRQIENVDFDLVARLYREQDAPARWSELAAKADPPPAFRLGDGNPRFSPRQACDKGRQALAAGQVGVILVAGGQGSRLGFEHPKGMFPIGPVSHVTLFQILIEKILARGSAAGADIPLYLMTSPATHEETLEYLEEHGRFGMPAGSLHVFCQGTMPAVDRKSGRLLLADHGELFVSPDGHGGMLAALDSSGGLQDIQQRGLKQLFYCQVDNPLVSMCDPQFLGYHVLSRSELSTQVVAKQTSRDKVGNVVMIDGRMQIIEYSDLNPLGDDVVERCGADCQPVFWAGNTAIHVFDVAFLQRMAGNADGLPFHIAKKAVPHIGPAGERVEPKEPNAIKFERFIFDLLPAAERAIVMEVDEPRVFAPVKNAPGEARDTAATVQARMISLHRDWLQAGGASVRPGVAVEISPLYAQEPDELRGKIETGLQVTQPRYFC